MERIKDYRSLSESQLKAGLKNLETNILEITHDPVDYHHYTPFLDWCGDEKAVEAIHEMMSDRCRILNLLFDIHSVVPPKLLFVLKLQQQTVIYLCIIRNICHVKKG